MNDEDEAYDDDDDDDPALTITCSHGQVNKKPGVHQVV